MTVIMDHYTVLTFIILLKDLVGWAALDSIKRSERRRCELCELE